MAPTAFDIWHIAFPVTDLSISLEFYRTLGFIVVGTDASTSKKQAFVAVKSGGFSIELFEPTEPLTEKKHPDHLAFDCADLEQFRRSLLEKMSQGLANVVTFENGVKCLSMRDPDGVCLEFFEGRRLYERSIAQSSEPLTP